jgi:hypothetical protein
MDEPEHVMVRYVRLRSEHLPVPIWSEGEGDEVTPILATWLAIVESREDRRESYELGFYTEDGRWLEGLQFETLAIAVDQAADIVRVRPDEWNETHAVMPDGDTIRWPSSG